MGCWPAPLRIGLFLMVLGAAWLPLGLPLYGVEERWTAAGPLALGLLYIVFLGLLPGWGRRIHDLSQPYRTLGLHHPGKMVAGLGVGLALGYLSVGALLGLQIGLGWGTLQPLPLAMGHYVWQGCLVGLGVGMAEELFFRGWLLFELEQDYSMAVALWGDAGLFAIAHYLRPLAAILDSLPQFVGLLLLGLTLVWARRTRLGHRSPSLALPIGLHGGLVGAYYVVDVTDMVRPAAHISPWLTGIGQNPLAGLLGLALLGSLAYGFYRGCHRRLP
ncbi:hypothetical protein XM38_002830 [Halomicronema hongdechloris C2206]|uniref:CAAX prenyl protease 2/Lysostaphin resistance protein A-like domain-containing protein n=2 Tax=Halomicronema hongdechloris TaxID=1209493 RepID=A0A1Z3HGF1_9CYAN|nr:hypothetical protein XM38_002830 [Halomicronema hongdechloris C2206]